MSSMGKMSLMAIVWTGLIMNNSLAADISKKNRGSYSSTITTKIHAKVSPSLYLKVGSPNQMVSISNAVDSTTTTVTASDSADQFFRDDSRLANYYGYYLSMGVTSRNQRTSNIQIRVREGASGTHGRSYFLMGNGQKTPKRESDLVAASTQYTTFAVVSSNVTHCGTNHEAARISDNRIDCNQAQKQSKLDLTQFVKVSDADQTSSTIFSQLEFVAVPY